MNFPAEQKAQFYTELAKLTGAGFSIVEAADSLLDQKLPRAQRLYLEALKDGVTDRGETIAGAIEAIPLVPVSALEKSIITASERGGQLAEGFGHLSEYYRMMHRATRRVRSGLVYPVVLLHSGILLPAAVTIVLAVDKTSAILHTVLILLAAYLVVAVVYFAARALVRRAGTSASADAWLRRIPVVGKVRRALSMSRFCKVFQIYLLAGQRMDTGLRAAAEASQSGVILRSVMTDVLPAVTGGDRAGGHLSKRVFAPAFVRSYITAEESGTLDTDMARWSAASHEDAVHSMDRLAAAAPKLVYVVIATFVIWQIFSMVNTHYFAPMRSLIDELN